MIVYITEVQHPQDHRKGRWAVVSGMASARRIAAQNQAFENTWLIIRNEKRTEILAYRDPAGRWSDA